MNPLVTLVSCAHSPLHRVRIQDSRTNSMVRMGPGRPCPLQSRSQHCHPARTATSCWWPRRGAVFELPTRERGGRGPISVGKAVIFDFLPDPYEPTLQSCATGPTVLNESGELCCDPAAE